MRLASGLGESNPLLRVWKNQFKFVTLRDMIITCYPQRNHIVNSLRQERISNESPGRQILTDRLLQIHTVPPQIVDELG